MNCIVCDDPISDARLHALPNTQTCVHCSDVKPVTAETTTSSAYGLAPALDRINTEGEMTNTRSDASVYAKRAEKPRRIIEELQMTPTPTDVFVR